MSAFAVLWSPILFGLALFLSSGLLFFVQPLIGRTVLPHFGGNPGVWNACLVCFQTMLLASYFYAGLMHRFQGLRWQPWVQMALLALAVLLCLAGVVGDRLLLDLAPRLPSLETWPILTTVCVLIAAIGLPFLAVAAVSPLVQRWFAHVDHPKATDPYFLFVASNLGGLTALILYPLIIESAPLYAQWMSWKLAVAGLGFVVFVIALCAWQSPRNPELEPAEPSADPDAPLVPKLIGRGEATWPRRCGWLFASALPVGLLLGVSDYLTLEVASIPVFWALPLALYLIAFSQSYGRFSPLDFGNTPVRVTLHIVYGMLLALAAALLLLVILKANPRGDPNDVGPAFTCGIFFALLLLVPFSWVSALQPIAAIGVVFVQANLAPRTDLNTGLMILYLTCFYLSVRLCLGVLAEDRPAAPALTTYCTWIGVGGLLGGTFSLLVAPALFSGAAVEFAFLAALAGTLRVAWSSHGLSDWLMCLALYRNRQESADTPATGSPRIALGFDIGLAAGAAILAVIVFSVRNQITTANTLLADVPLIFALLAALSLFVRPLRFGLALSAIVALSWIGQAGPRGGDTIIALERSSFGSMRVVEREHELRAMGFDPPKYAGRVLFLGNARRGSSITAPPELLRLPTDQYHRKGPVGQLLGSKLEWFREPGMRLRNEDAAIWMQRNRDNAKDDARIAASLVGIMTVPLGTSPFPLDPLVTAWSEPPVAVIGLGAGSLFAYAHPFQWVDAFEVNPRVISLSTDIPSGDTKPVFHYHHAAQKRGVNAQIIAGDARRNLTGLGRDRFYHAIFIDAASSGAVPTHLFTKEAIDLYLQKLTPNGILCFHTTHPHLDLASMLDSISRRHKLTARALRVERDPMKPGVNTDPGLIESQWTLIAHNAATLQEWTKDEAFGPREERLEHPLRASPRLVWTDQHANVLAAARPNLGWPGAAYGLLVTLLVFGLFYGVAEIVYSMFSPSNPRRADEA